jgi:hypothetical protein
MIHRDLMRDRVTPWSDHRAVGLPRPLVPRAHGKARAAAIIAQCLAGPAAAAPWLTRIGPASPWPRPRVRAAAARGAR